MKLNNYIIEVQADISKVKGILFAIENTYLCIEPIPEDRERYENAVNTFYALCDAVNRLSDDIDSLSRSDN